MTDDVAPEVAGGRNTLKVVLFDDDMSRVETWKAKVSASIASDQAQQHEVFAVTAEQFADIFESLKDRQSGARGNDSAGDSEDLRLDAAFLDDADIVIVDFDLTPAQGQAQQMEPEALRTLRGSFGDTFAYLTRCYTSAAYIVLVNQTFYQSTFDLTMREFENSPADLNLSDSDLDNTHLWTGANERREFRPWHWPRLLEAGEFIQSLADKIDLDAKVLETLGLDSDDLVDLFHPHQIAVFGKVSPQDATFRDLTRAEAKYGVRSRSEVLDEPNLKRLAAAALNSWLHRLVLPGQNILVDAPHLAQRRPHLIQGDRTAERLDLLGNLTKVDEIGDLLNLAALEVAQTKASEWTNRPVWLWPACPRGPVSPDQLVFCEDTSTFDAIDEVQEFRSELPGPFQTRFVVELKAGSWSVEYRPEGRFH